MSAAFERRSPARWALSAVGAVALSLGALSACSDPFGIATAQATVTGVGDAGDEGPQLLTTNEDCPAGDDWLPADGGPTPPVPMFTPAPHPDTECPFYRGAYQNFLIATQPDSNGDPALVHFASISDAFQSQFANGFTRNTGDLNPDGSPLDPSKSPDPCKDPTGYKAALAGPATGKAWLGVVKQAGARNILIDQDHHTLYYGLHMNQAFVDFLRENGLTTAKGILAVGGDSNLQNLEFPPGVTEFKTAWKDIDPRDFKDSNGNYCTTDPKIVPPPNNVYADDPGDYSNYITTYAWLPWLHADASGTITEDPDHPILRRVALVAIHSVYTLPGHPEFIWGTIQHVNINHDDPAVLSFAGVSMPGAPDTQPDTTSPDGGAALPTQDDPTNSMVSTPLLPPNQYMLLAKGGTPENQGNKAINESALSFDEQHQNFIQAQTTAYRVFPGSKSTTLEPDTAVFSLDSNLNTMFAQAIANKVIDPNVDKRQNYRLVAAVWLDKPALFGLGSDGTGMLLQNDDSNPLVVAAKTGDPMPGISQGVTCGTPRGPNGESGDAPGATGFNNTVPGCDTRADELDAKGALAPAATPIDPSMQFQNGEAGTDSPFSILGGEDRLSSTAMETFTQTGAFNNCFTCHNTGAINTNGTPIKLANITATIPFPAKINVSHMFSEFMAQEAEAQARLGDAGAGSSSTAGSSGSSTGGDASASSGAPTGL